jgi:hypothetical protein
MRIWNCRQKQQVYTDWRSCSALSKGRQSVAQKATGYLYNRPYPHISSHILTYPHISSHILLSVWRLSGKINTKATEQHSDKKAQLQAAELQDTTINVHQELWNGSNFPSKADILMDLLWIYLWISKQLCIPMSTFVPIYSTSGRHVIKRSWVTLRKPHGLADLRHQVRRTRR